MCVSLRSWISAIRTSARMCSPSWETTARRSPMAARSSRVSMESNSTDCARASCRSAILSNRSSKVITPCHNSVALPRHRALRGRAHQSHVLVENSGRVLGSGSLPILQPRFQLGGGDLQVDAPVLDIEQNDIAFPNGGDGPAYGGFRRHVSGHESARGAAEAA